MSVAVDPAPVASSTPVQYVVPRVHGDPAAARRLAASYRAVADDVAVSARTAARVLDGLTGTWHGRAAHATAHPAEVLHRNAVTTTRSLHAAADALDAYAHKLEAAQSHHWFSMHKLIAVAAVVTVTAVAVVVTMGAAAAAEAALAATAAGEATAAAGAATVATEGAAAGLLESTAELTALRALLSFAVPHLVQAELSAGFAASMEEEVDGRLDWHEIGVAAGAGFVGSAGAGAATRVTAGVKFAKEAWPLLHALMPHLGQAVAWGGADAAQQSMDGGHLSLRELLLAGGLAGVGSAMPAIGGTAPLVAKAYVGRQTLDQMLTDGVNLSAHEGQDLGHTLAKHVDVTNADLLRRIATEGRREASRFLDMTIAERAVSDALCLDAQALREFAASTAAHLQVRVTLDHVVGVVIRGDGSSTPTGQLVVWLRKDADGIYISSAYPELPR